MSETLFRHRLAVILGAFLLAFGAAWAGRMAQMASLADLVGLERSFVWTAPLLVIAFVLRVAGEARLGGAVYGQRASARVVTSGIFAVMRHPLYLGTWLFFVATCAPYHAPTALGVLALAFAFALRAIAAHEESALARAHGDAWTRYAALVPAIGAIPRKTEPDEITVNGRAIGAAIVGNLGFAALALYRTVSGTVGAPRGLASLTLVLLAVWFAVLLWRRFRRSS